MYVVLSPACNYWTRGGAASVPCLVLPSPQFPYICSEVIVSASFSQLYHFGLHPTTHRTKTLSEESSKDRKVAKNFVSIYLDRSSVQLHAKDQKCANSKSLFDLGKSLEQNEAIQDDGFVFCQLVSNHLHFKQKFLNKSHEM